MSPQTCKAQRRWSFDKNLGAKRSELEETLFIAIIIQVKKVSVVFTWFFGVPLHSSGDILLHRKLIMSIVLDEGMTPRSLILVYPVPAKEEARSKDTWSPLGPALRLGVEGKKYL
jgi:hypothetical protein